MVKYKVKDLLNGNIIPYQNNLENPILNEVLGNKYSGNGFIYWEDGGDENSQERYEKARRNAMTMGSG